MPVNGNFTQKVEIRNGFKAEDNIIDWEKGTMVNTVAKLYSTVDTYNNNNIYECRLQLAQIGIDIEYFEDSTGSFSTYKELSNLQIVNGSLKLSINPSTSLPYDVGYRTFEIDLTRLGAYGNSKARWNCNTNYDAYDGSGQAVKLFVSHDNGTTWTKITQPSSDSQSFLYYSTIPGFTQNQSTNNKKILIKEEIKRGINNENPELQNTEFYIYSAYKSSGTWTSPKIPVSDKRVTEMITQVYTLYDDKRDPQYGNPSSTFKCEVSYDNGTTWIQKADYQFIPQDQFDKVRYLLIKFTFGTTDTGYSKYVTKLEVDFWSEIDVIDTTTKSSDKTIIKEFDFATSISKNYDVTWELLTDQYSFKREVKLTQTVGSKTNKILGLIVEKPRVIKSPGREEIVVKCYDKAHKVTDLIFMDKFPKYDVDVTSHTRLLSVFGNSLTYRDIDRWDYVVAYVWALYGPEEIQLTLGTGGIEDFSSTISPISNKFGSIYDFMDKICKFTGWVWEMNENQLRFYKPTASIIDAVFETNRNIIGSPEIDDDLPKIANVVFMETTKRQPGYTEYQRTDLNKTQYFLSYEPLKREFESKSGTVELDKPPVVYLKQSDGTYLELATYEDGATIEAGQPAAQAYYHIENKWVKLVNPPTLADNNGIKIVYTIELKSILRRENPESIAIFGEKHHIIGTKMKREEAEIVANNYLLEHSFPIQPVSFETTEWGYKVGDYVRVVIPEQGIDQVMPIAQIETKASSMNMDVKVVLNRAPFDESDLIIDLFNRLKSLEKENVGDEATIEQYYTLTDNTSISEQWYVNGVINGQEVVHSE